MSQDRRRDSEALLASVQKRESESTRGRLRIYLGMCPGVGKTFTMLKAASEQAARGREVLVGVVETHGRKETEALLAGLKILERAQLDYKGTRLHEMDLDAILKARPSLVLVDELAHTNAHGCRHQKRYQDVEEILKAGIDVYSTLNIQHLESRNDTVAQITGVRVRETVPDSFVAMANQVELVDLSPDELLRRLKEGKVYLGDRAEAAMQNFFQEEHLSALREMALRFTAEKVDRDLHDQMTIKGISGPWNTNERLLVALSHSPYAARLIRAARRMAFNLEAPWIALFVDTGKALEKDDSDALQENLELARRLGAEVISSPGVDIASTIQRVCAEKNVTQVIMGRPDRRFFPDLLRRGTLLDQLVGATSEIDVHVIRAERKPRYTGFHLSLPKLNSSWQAYYNSIWFLIGVSFLCYALLPLVGYRALGSIFLLAILVVASLAGRGPIFLVAVLSTVIWDFVFIPPAFTLRISTSEDAMMVFSFLGAAALGGFLTSRIKRQEQTLESRERRTRLLYELTQSLSDAKNSKEIQEVLASVVDRQFGGACTLYFADEHGAVDWAEFTGRKLSEKELAVALWSFENNKPAGWSTQTLSASKSICLPIRGRAGMVGVVSFMPLKSQRDFSIEKEVFINAVLSQAAIAHERLRFADAAASARLYEASEALHQTLLNSISHELRTPITAVIGSATALREEKTLLDPVARQALTGELIASGLRLDRVVENLLDISRLEKGAIQLKREWFYLSEMVQEVKIDLAEEAGRLELHGDFEILLEGDFGLLQHAVTNVVQNALKYSAPLDPVQLEAHASSHTLFLRVKDLGAGIPAEAREGVFEKFFRLPGTPSGGLGLGLNIVKSIFTLHGGKVSNFPREGGRGTVFQLELPRAELPLELKTLL